MKSTLGRISFGVSLLALGALAAPVARASDHPADENPAVASSAAADWLEIAFRFATALDADPKDRAKAQELVVRELIELGRIDEAIRRAEVIEGWRQAVCLAELAAEKARSGDDDAAMRMIVRAEEERRKIRGWQNPRIAAHIAGAYAAMGNLEVAERIASDLIGYDAQQYSGEAVARVAATHAARGDYDAAVKRLRALDDRKDIYETWWRTMGYLEVARAPDMTREQRLEALEAAGVSAEGVDAGARPAALESIAKEYVELGKTEKARALLEKADEMVQSGGGSPAVRSALLTGLAQAWATAGGPDRARSLLAKVEPLIAQGLDIERPGMYGALAAAYQAADAPQERDRLLGRALSEAAALRNARPRCLAIVAICRQMAGAGVDLDGTNRTRLEEIYRGLGAPW